jgi:hypothetical protein
MSAMLTLIRYQRSNLVEICTCGFNSAEHVINLFRVNNNIQFCFFGIYFSPSKPKHCLQGTALLSTVDELKTMIRPTSEYMKAIAGGIGVATDKEIIRAALQPAMTGEALPVLTWSKSVLYYHLQSFD